MTGQDIIDRIGQRRGEVVNEAEEEQYILDALNEVYDEVLSFHDWPWLIDHAHYRTWPLWEGVGDVTADNTTVANIDDPALTADEQVAYVGGYFVGPGREFHRIESITGPNDLELAENWIGDTEPDAAIEMWQDTIPMAETVEHIISVGDPHAQTTGYQLVEQSEYQINQFVTDRRQPDSESLVHWSRDGLTADGAPQIRLWPIPQGSIYLDICYKRRPPHLANAADCIPELPLRWHHVLVAGVMARLAEDDGLEANAVLRLKSEYLGMLERMVGELAKKSVVPRRYGRWDQAYPPGRDPNMWWQFVVQ